MKYKGSQGIDPSDISVDVKCRDDPACKFEASDPAKVKADIVEMLGRLEKQGGLFRLLSRLPIKVKDLPRNVLGRAPNNDILGIRMSLDFNGLFAETIMHELLYIINGSKKMMDRFRDLIGDQRLLQIVGTYLEFCNTVFADFLAQDSSNPARDIMFSDWFLKILRSLKLNC